MMSNMNPNEIKKALECCKSPVGSGACNSCPFDYQRKKRLAPTEGSCTILMLDCVLVCINELETENKRLNKKVEELSEVLSDSIKIKVKEIKSEAIKEFAERLKSKLFYECGDINYSEVCENRRLIDNLVKEMVGENNA